jgi:transposase-like protein
LFKNGRTRQFRSKLERRRIVEETLKPGASVSLVARAHEQLREATANLAREGLSESQNKWYKAEQHT